MRITSAAAISAIVGTAALGLAVIVPAHAQNDTTSAAPTEMVSLTDAVLAAEAEASARAIDAELDDDDGRSVYEIELVKDGTRHDALVDPMSGEVLSVNKVNLLERAGDAFHKERFGEVEAAPRSLGEIMRDLEASSGGTVHEAELDSEDGTVVYEIEIATDQGLREMNVDVKTGEARPDLDD